MAVQAQMYPDTSGFLLDDWTGGGVGMRDEMCVNLQRQQQMLQFQNRIQQQQQNQNQVAADTSSFSAFPQGFVLGSVLEEQILEIDHVIRSQSERVRLVLREQRKRLVSELIRKIEAKTSRLLKHKDEVIARAATRTSHLESLILKLQNEAQAWQNIARQNELHVVNLRNAIQMLQQSAAAHGRDTVVEDSESSCDESHHGGKMILCIMCREKERSVVLLPCRHLCCCTVCADMIEFCPVCQTEKKAIVEALFC